MSSTAVAYLCVYSSRDHGILFTMGRTIILWGRGTGQFLRKKKFLHSKNCPKKSCKESYGGKNEQLLSTIIILSLVVKNVLHKLYPIKKTMHGLKV